MLDHEEIQRKFEVNKIPTGNPGFYDHPNFKSLEAADPQYLNNYARFVQTKSYSDEYIRSAEKKVPQIVDLIYSELVKDNKPQDSREVAMVLSKVLEKEGFWNYIVKGALSIYFPSDTNVVPKFYYPIDIIDEEAGHYWVVVPPFTVLDITVKLQSYCGLETKYIPNFIMEKHCEPSEIDPMEVCSFEVRHYYKSLEIPVSNLLQTIEPELLEFSKVFHPLAVRCLDTTFKYSPCAIIAPDAIENNRSIKIHGYYGIDIYKKFVKPFIEKKC